MADFKSALMKRAGTMDFKSALMRHAGTEDDQHQQQLTELLHVLPQAQNAQLSQLWPLLAADQTSTPNFAQIVAAALGAGKSLYKYSSII